MAKKEHTGLLGHPMMRPHIVVGVVGGFFVLMGWSGIASAVESVAKGGWVYSNDWKFSAASAIFGGALAGAALARIFDAKYKEDHVKTSRKK